MIAIVHLSIAGDQMSLASLIQNVLVLLGLVNFYKLLSLFVLKEIS